MAWLATEPGHPLETSSWRPSRLPPKTQLAKAMVLIWESSTAMMTSKKGRRTSGVFLEGLLAAALSSACSGETLTAPMNTTTATTSGAPSASVRALSNLSFTSCTSDGNCSFEGQILNDGPDCAKNVRGVTHLLDASGTEIEQRQWTVVGRVRPGLPEAFSGCCFSSNAVSAQRGSRTEVFFEPLLCV